jgi:hypothetical protein
MNGALAAGSLELTTNAVAIVDVKAQEERLRSV